MKNILTTLALVFSIGFAHAQTASFDSKTSKTVIDNENVSFNFTLEEVNGNQKEIAEKMKAHKGINNVTINGNIVKVDLPKANSKGTMNSMLLSVGIKTVKVDGKTMPTNELMSYLREQKAQKK
jgi:hypothetical protein